MIAHRALTSKYHMRYNLLKSNGLLEASSSQICGVQCFDAQCNVQKLLKKFKVSSMIKNIKCSERPFSNEQIAILSPNMKIIIQKRFSKESLKKELEICCSPRKKEYSKK